MKRLQAIATALLAWGPLGALFLGFLDSVGIPLPGGVDLLILTMAAQNPHAGFVGAGLAALGSLAGSMVLFLIARKGGEVYLDRKTQKGSAKRFRQWFHHYGGLTVLIPALIPVPGLPLKIFVLCAGALGMRRIHFAGIILIARIVRYFGLAWLGVQMGTYPWQYIKTHAWQFLLASILIFLLSYAAVRVMDYLRMRAHHHHGHHS